MALPAHLARYDGLIDLLVEEVVREMEEQVSEMKPPASTANRAGGGINSERDRQRGNHRPSDPAPARVY